MGTGINYRNMTYNEKIQAVIRLLKINQLGDPLKEQIKIDIKPNRIMAKVKNREYYFAEKNGSLTLKI